MIDFGVILMSYYHELSELGRKTFDGTGYAFKLGKFLGSSNGYITEPFSKSKKKQVVVGAKDLFLGMLVGRDDPKKFTTGLVCLFHEQTHSEQFVDIASGNADSDIAYSFMARQMNDRLYRYNYKSMAYELAAEHYGVMKAHAYIKENHPELNADDCIKVYIDQQLAKGDARYASRSFGDFPDKQYVDFSKCNNITEINDMFDVLRSCVNKYDLNSVEFMRSYNGARNPEENNLLFDVFDDNTKNIDIFKSLPGSYEQLKFASACYADRHPEQSSYFKHYPVLSDSDYLSVYDKVTKENPYMSKTKIGLLMANELSNIKPKTYVSDENICGYSDEVQDVPMFDSASGIELDEVS